MWNIPVKILDNKAHLPTRGSDWAAGYDLYAATDHFIMIPPHTTVKVGTGLAFELPKGTFGAIYARSGLASKKGLRPANCVGVVDADYRGEIIVALHNDTEATQTIEPHERIAQFILMQCFEMEFTEFENLTDTERGDGGFGSTGTK